MDFSHELVVPNRDLPFKLFLFEGKNGGYFREKHWHRSVEIFAVLAGSLTFSINEEKTRLKDGEFILVNSNEIHSIAAPDPNQTVVLQIPLKALEDYCEEEKPVTFAHRTCGQDREVVNLVREMYRIYTAHETGYELLVQSCYYRLLYLLVTVYRKEQKEEQKKQSRRLEKLSRITAYIKENYRSPLSLDQVAARFGYSPAYLSRMFRKYAGINYNTYLLNVRLDSAYRELMNTHQEVGRIAEENGFPDGRAFSRAFRKKYGCVPSRYRKGQTGQKSASD